MILFWWSFCIIISAFASDFCITLGFILVVIVCFGAPVVLLGGGHVCNL
jgi:hypothetical protein